MRKGFTLIELLIVMSVVAILVSVVIPSLRGLQQEVWITQAEKETQTIQTAIESYFRHKNTFPANISNTIQNAQPKVVFQELKDPWKTAGNTYGYVTGNASNGEAYYIVYSVGTSTSGSYTVNNDKVYIPQGMIAVSNLPVLQQ